MRIINGTFMEKSMIIGAKIFGKMCSKMILPVGAPSASAEFMYIFSLIPITRLLNILVLPIPFEIPKTIITCHNPGLMREIITINSNKLGMLNSASINLCSIRSNIPPM